jgi:hypothetical protein
MSTGAFSLLDDWGRDFLVRSPQIQTRKTEGFALLPESAFVFMGMFCSPCVVG